MSATSSAPESAAAPPDRPPRKPKSKPGKGVRKWHPRTFTGCLQCRRRHVKCDEAAGHCNNCKRLGLECDGYAQKATFKVFVQEDYDGGRRSSRDAGKDEAEVKGRALQIRFAADGGAQAKKRIKLADSDEDIKEEEDDVIELRRQSTSTAGEQQSAWDSMYAYSTDLASSSTADRQQLAQIAPLDLVCTDTRYYSHFLLTVSSLLIVYDTPSNWNPFRYFPQFADSFWPLMETMKAMGAMHIANISTKKEERALHARTAMVKYGEVVRELSNSLTTETPHSKLAIFATSLLLSMFEVGAPKPAAIS